MEPRQWLTKPVVLFAIVWMLLSCIAYNAIPQDSEYYWWIAYMFYLSAPTAAAAFVLFLTRLYGLRSVEGKVWGMLGLGLLLWCMGEWLWFYYVQIAETDPFPSLADYLYIAGYAPLLVGVCLKARESVAKITSKGASLIASSVLLASAIIAAFVVIPIMDAGDYGPAEKAISLTYPLLDVVLLTFALAIVSAFWDMRESSAGWILFSFGIVVTTAADIMFSALDWKGIYYAQMDLLWVIAYLLFLTGAAYQHIYHKSLMGE